MSESPVIIVGAGLAGLCCGIRLQEAGRPFKILEATKKVGRRVKTDSVDGFRLDRGFQVLLTEYPEAKRVLDYDLLDLRNFEPGAMIRVKGKFRRFADPWRRPRHLVSTAFSPVATFMDKLRMAKLRSAVARKNVLETQSHEEMTTMNYLLEQGFSSRIIDQFFRPFLGGVFLESELNTTSRKFEFVFNMFSRGFAAIPANGMGAIAEQLANKISPNDLVLNSKVASIKGEQVQMESGEIHQGSKVVVACESNAASKILGDQPPRTPHEVFCLYFAADTSPIKESVLLLNGEGFGPINNLCVPSQLSSTLAPEGKSLVSATVLPTSLDALKVDLESAVQNQLIEWFGAEAKTWDHLKTFHIRNALPQQTPPTEPGSKHVILRRDGVIQCGDYVSNASIQGAMLSGRIAAEKILEQ